MPVIGTPVPASLVTTVNTTVFSRIYAAYSVAGPPTGLATIYWELNPRFSDSSNHVFQLQVSQTQLVDGDWVNVGSPVTNVYLATDDTRRLYGKQLNVFYRIRLTTDRAVYYSQPTSVFAKLNKRDWLLVREITRKELLRLQKYTAIEGYLLKTRRNGVPCNCIDPTIGESVNSQCPDCFGTGFNGGFYTPLPCTFFDVTPDQRYEYRDLEARGMVDDDIKETRFVGYPYLQAYDVIINKYSDERYIVRKTKNLAEMRGYPVVVSAELRLAPFSDIIYTYSISQTLTNDVITNGLDFTLPNDAVYTELL